MDCSFLDLTVNAGIFKDAIHGVVGRLAKNAAQNGDVFVPVQEGLFSGRPKYKQLGGNSIIFFTAGHSVKPKPARNPPETSRSRSAYGFARIRMVPHRGFSHNKMCARTSWFGRVVQLEDGWPNEIFQKVCKDCARFRTSSFRCGTWPVSQKAVSENLEVEYHDLER